MSVNKINNTGGIDLKSDKLNVETRTDSTDGEIAVNVDAAMLERLNNSTGLIPIVTGIEVLNDVPKFLGVSN